MGTGSPRHCGVALHCNVSARIHFLRGGVQRQEPVLGQALLPETSIESLYEGVVSGITGPAEVQFYSVEVGPLVQSLGGELGTVVHPDGSGQPALLLQSHDKVSDAEAKTRADFDIRWKVALGIEVEGRPFAKSTLQVFRAQLILHDKVREVFESSLRLARESGCLKKRDMKVALDTTNILGRGAVKNTYNMLADGIFHRRVRLLVPVLGEDESGHLFPFYPQPLDFSAGRHR